MSLVKTVGSSTAYILNEQLKTASIGSYNTPINFCFFLLFIELETSRAIPVPQDVMGKIITAARVGSVIPVDVAVKGYTVCMERVIKFASMVDFFKE